MGYNPSELVHTYVFGPGTKVSIDTPFVKDMSEIKKEVVKHTPEEIIYYSEYPKGFKILISQYSDRIEYKTNYELIETTPNQFSIEFP